MLSALFLINAKGEIIIYRLYRDDVSLSAANAFRLQVIAAKEAGASAPVRSIDGNTFLYVRHKDMFFVAVTRSNSNAGESTFIERDNKMTRHLTTFAPL
jgi:AP-2 complex subunit mu-1